jgi:hypothetical protein
MVVTEFISYSKNTFFSVFKDFKIWTSVVNIEIKFIERLDHVNQYKQDRVTNK